MSFDRAFRPTSEDPPVSRAPGVPGKSTLTARIQRVVHAQPTAGAGDADHAVAAAGRGAGAPLPSGVRERFEASLGADLGAVRVHTGPESQAAAAAVGARAYAHGSDVHFAAGQYQPDDPFGMHLLAHEVAHTVQQAGGTAQRQHKLELSTPGDAAEVEADRAADAMVAGAPFALGGAASVVARAADEQKPVTTELTQTSIKVAKGPVSGAIDWSTPPPKGTLTLETELMKLPNFARQVKIASYYEMVGLAFEFRLEPTLKASGSLSGTGSFEAGKGGTVQITSGGAQLECGLSGSGRLMGYLGALNEGNVNAGAFGTIGTKTTAAVKSTGAITLGPDGKASGSGAVVEGSVAADATAQWGLDVGTYANKEAKTIASLQIGEKSLGKVSGLGFRLTIGADGSVSPIEWKSDVVWEPPTLPIVEKARRPMTPQEEARYCADRERAERDGGSGGGAGVPPEALDDPNEDQTFAEQCAGEDASVMCDPGGDPDSIMYGSGPGAS